MKTSDELLKRVQAEINKRGVSSLEEANEVANEIMNEHNTQAHPDFEGLSPSQMHFIINDPESERVVRFQDNIDPVLANKLPVNRIASVILKWIDPDKGLKLTTTGRLPRKVVTEIYEIGFFMSEYERLYKPPRMNESEVLPAETVRILLEISGFVKVSKKVMKLTRKGKKVLEDPVELFKGLFRVFAYRYHKGWKDNYQSEEIGNVGFMYTVYLLSRYGEKFRSGEFYADYYFKAFPMLYTLEERFPNPNESCFEWRVLVRGLPLFGVVDTHVKKPEHGYGWDYQFKCSSVFEKIFSIEV